MHSQLDNALNDYQWILEDLVERIKFALWTLEEALGELGAINKFLTDFGSDEVVDSGKITRKLYSHFHRIHADVINCDVELNNMISELSETTANDELIGQIKSVKDMMADVIDEYDVVDESLADLEEDELVMFATFTDAIASNLDRMNSNVSCCHTTLNDMLAKIMI